MKFSLGLCVLGSFALLSCATTATAPNWRASCATGCADAASWLDCAARASNAGDMEAAGLGYGAGLRMQPSGGVRLDLGASLVVVGDVDAAREQFGAVLRESADPLLRDEAAAWLQEAEMPVRVALYYSTAQGCPD